MRFSQSLVGLVAVGVTAVQAAAPAAVTATSSPFKVSVGADGLTYTPSNIIAEVGTLIEFDFFPKNHTVTQSSFADPCHPLAAGGFFSGFVPVNDTNDTPSATTFTITVANAQPIWFYCSQTVGTHCQKGMVGAINAPAQGNTLDKFIILASNATQSTAPPGGAVGGELDNGAGGDDTSSSSSLASTTSTFTSAVTTSAVLTTYTSASTTFVSTIGESTILSTGATAAPQPTGLLPVTPANGASGMGANLVAVAAVLCGVVAVL